MLHIITVPDCPKCGKEMTQRMRYIPGTQTKQNPFGKKVYWLECDECGHKEEDEYEVR